VRITVLVGGVGGARFLLGVRALPDVEVTAVVNVGDDIWLHGLRICPDLDTCMYTLGGGIDTERGWGRSGETWAVRDELAAYGADPDWFGLGDRDLATHLLRTHLLRSGMEAAAVTAELARRLGLRARVIPMTEHRVRTKVTTPKGRLDLQEYFVRERHALPVSAVEIAGAEEARPAPGVAEVLREADKVIIGPSNPAISIEPILAVIGDLIDPARTMAVTPIVAGAALKGPTVEMLQGLGREPTPTGIARGYRPYATTFVLDHKDADQAAAIHALGYRVVLLDTVMAGPAGRARLAEELALV